MGIFEYVAVLTSIIIGLGLTHLLRGVARVVQHPGRQPAYGIHLLWAFYLFLLLVFWWWWEFRLGELQIWTFQVYLFVLLYAVVLYFLCAIVYPPDLKGYEGYRDYYFSRRRWFFGVCILSIVIDVVDTLLKGAEHFAGLGWEYRIAQSTRVVTFAGAMWTANEKYHAAIALANVIWMLSFALRMFGTAA